MDGQNRSKGIDLTELLGELKRRRGLGAAESRGRDPVGGQEDEVPQKLKLFL